MNEIREVHYFALEIVARAEYICEQGGDARLPYTMLELSLQQLVTPVTWKAYFKTVKLLRQAADEAMAEQPTLSHVGAGFRWDGRHFNEDPVCLHGLPLPAAVIVE